MPQFSVIKVRCFKDNTNLDNLCVFCHKLDRNNRSFGYIAAYSYCFNCILFIYLLLITSLGPFFCSELCYSLSHLAETGPSDYRPGFPYIRPPPAGDSPVAAGGSPFSA